MNKPKKNEIRIFAAFVTKGISLRLHQTKSVGDVAAVEIMGGQWISSALSRCGTFLQKRSHIRSSQSCQSIQRTQQCSSQTLTNGRSKRCQIYRNFLGPNHRILYALSSICL